MSLIVNSTIQSTCPCPSMDLFTSFKNKTELPNPFIMNTFKVLEQISNTKPESYYIKNLSKFTSKASTNENIICRIFKTVNQWLKPLFFDEFPLHNAIRNRNLEAFELFLEEYNADVNLKNNFNETPLHLAVFFNESLIARKLLEYGAEFNVKNDNGYTPLLGAVVNKDLSTVEKLIALGADLNIQDKNGYTPLFWAVVNKDLSTVEKLVAFGANLNIKDKDGRTPLLWAVAKKDLPTVEKLITSGADLNIKDKDGYTPLSWAVFNKDLATVEKLVAFGADLNIKDKDGWTPLRWAVVKKDLPTVEKLIALGADLNVQDKDGYTPLMEATISQEPSIISALLDAKASKTVLNNNGRNVLIECMLEHQENCHEILKIDKDVYSEKYFSLKELSHIFELRGKSYLEGDAITSIINLERAQEDQFINYFRNCVIEFSKNYENHFTEEGAFQINTLLKQSLKLKNLKPEEIAEKIKKGENVLFNAGFKGHALSILFQEDYLIIGNKGTATRQPIEVFKINKDKITEDVIREIMTFNLSDGTEENYLKWLHGIEKNFDAVSHDLLAKFIEGNYPFDKKQDTENCIWESLETGVYASFILERLKHYDFKQKDWALYEKIVEKGNRDFAILKQFFKVNALQEFINHSKPYDIKIIWDAFIKAWKVDDWNEQLAKEMENLEKSFLNTLSEDDRLIFEADKIRVRKNKSDRITLLGYP